MPIGVQIGTLFFAGTAQLSEKFAGAFQAVSTVQIQQLQLGAQVSPAGGNVTVALVDASGNPLGAEVTLLAATRYANIDLPAPLTLAPGDVVQAIFTEVDLGVAQYFMLNLMGATAQFPVGPCCCGP